MRECGRTTKECVSTPDHSEASRGQDSISVSYHNRTRREQCPSVPSFGDCNLISVRGDFQGALGGSLGTWPGRNLSRPSERLIEPLTSQRTEPKLKAKIECFGSVQCSQRVALTSQATGRLPLLYLSVEHQSAHGLLSEFVCILSTLRRQS